MLTLRTAAITVAVVGALAAAGACSSKDKGDEGDDTTEGTPSDAASAATAKPADAAPKAPSTATDGAPAGDPEARDGGATASATPDATPATDTKPPPDKKKKLENIKALPKSWSYEKVEKLMKTYERALGEECEFCHDEDDYASDDNKHKKVAREMIEMQNALNRKYFKGQSKITCYTCHLGKKEPK